MIKRDCGERMVNPNQFSVVNMLNNMQIICITIETNYEHLASSITFMYSERTVFINIHRLLSKEYFGCQF